MTVEIFYPGDDDPDGEALRSFAQAILIATRTDSSARPRRVLRSLDGLARHKLKASVKID